MKHITAADAAIAEAIRATGAVDLRIKEAVRDGLYTGELRTSLMAELDQARVAESEARAMPRLYKCACDRGDCRTTDWPLGDQVIFTVVRVSYKHPEGDWRTEQFPEDRARGLRPVNIVLRERCCAAMGLLEYIKSR